MSYFNCIEEMKKYFYLLFLPNYFFWGLANFFVQAIKAKNVVLQTLAHYFFTAILLCSKSSFWAFCAQLRKHKCAKVD